jgi:glycosyltransferase involved in cell wall biosynthesis
MGIFTGFNYFQMDCMLEKKFAGMAFDACTVVGNCLLITRKCLNDVGYLDEIYGTGYGEETDYQFKAYSKGFEAKVAIDTYVYHKAEVSFGVSDAKREKIEKNRHIFFSRWEREYQECLKKYKDNDPIKFIIDNLTPEDKIIKEDILFYLPAIAQNIGGVHVVIDIINYLNIAGINANVIYDSKKNYDEPILFSAIKSNEVSRVNTKCIVSTLYTTAFPLKEIAVMKNIPLISFIQGYEGLFDNGDNYAIVALSYKLPDYLLCISKYLHDEILTIFGRESTVISNGINYDLLHNFRVSGDKKTITFVLRNNIMKGDWILLDILNKLLKKANNININIIYQNKDIKFPENKNQSIVIHKYIGPLSRDMIADILKNSDIFIDASLNEGFGLFGIEAMAAGCVPISSNSLGNLAYLKNEYNGILVNEVNNSNRYVEKILWLLENEEEFIRLKCGAIETAKHFDLDDRIDKYINYFRCAMKTTNNDLNMSSGEKNIYQKMNAIKETSDVGIVHPNKKILIRRIAAKVLPVPIKEKIRSFLKKLVTD